MKHSVQHLPKLASQSSNACTGNAVGGESGSNGAMTDDVPEAKVEIFSTAPAEDVTKRVYRQHNTKRGYEFFIDTISYKYGRCAGRVWIDKKANLSKQCSRLCGFMDGTFCKQHRKTEEQSSRESDNA